MSKLLTIIMTIKESFLFIRSFSLTSITTSMLMIFSGSMNLNWSPSILSLFLLYRLIFRIKSFDEDLEDLVAENVFIDTAFTSMMVTSLLLETKLNLQDLHKTRLTFDNESEMRMRIIIHTFAITKIIHILLNKSKIMRFLTQAGDDFKIVARDDDLLYTPSAFISLLMIIIVSVLMVLNFLSDVPLFDHQDEYLTILGMVALYFNTRVYVSDHTYEVSYILIRRFSTVAFGLCICYKQTSDPIFTTVLSVLSTLDIFYSIIRYEKSDNKIYRSIGVLSGAGIHHTLIVISAFYY